jgi:hypothetical protein
MTHTDALLGDPTVTVLIDTVLGAGGGDVAPCADAVAATPAKAAHEIRVEIVALRHGI